MSIQMFTNYDWPRVEQGNPPDRCGRQDGVARRAPELPSQDAMRSVGGDDQEENVVELDASTRDELIRSHLRLVVSVAKRYAGRSVSLMDLVSEGNAALVRAAARFRPERGVRFATYAFPWIEHAVRGACLRDGDVIAMPPAMKRAVYAYRRLLSSREPGSELSPREVAEHLGISVDLASSVIAAATGMKTLTGQGGADRDPDPTKLVASKVHDNPLTRLESEESSELLASVLGSLSERRRQVLAMHFGLDGYEPMTRAAIAAHLGITVESVDWAIERALNRLRVMMHRRQVA
jgi:RNA polymerase primary sigma factor